MTTTSPVGRSIERAAVERVRKFLASNDDQTVFTLVELSEATAMDPNTAESAMNLLADSEIFEEPEFTVSRHDSEYGELQWTVRQSVAKANRV